MYEKVAPDMNFGERELKTLRFWDENDIFEKSQKLRENGPYFTFYDGPPTANGKPHIGHVVTRVVKDIIPRYKTMKGYSIIRKAGWDTHGLPVELEVEKALGISGKPDIERYGIEPFIQKCKESVWRYEQDWRDMSHRVGYWIDLDEPYVTYHDTYIESVWWSLRQIWDKGLMYKGHKVVPYCPRCGTALSSHEVAQGYQEVEEASAYVNFKVKGKDNEYLMAWTTTPWTLPSNVCLAVNADENYARVRCENKVYILAEALLETVLQEKYEIMEVVKGTVLEGIEYEPLYKVFEPEGKSFVVVCDHYVTLSDGTGIVHNAPAFGEDDARVCRTNGLPFIQPVDARGKFTESVPHWAGMFVRDTDLLIMDELKSRGQLYRAQQYAHSYPFCWRCDTSLLYYARDTWFIEMTKLRDELVTNNEKVNWLPENIKHGRFGNFLENVVDWGLSRERYWGTPLPIWECACGHRHMIGSVAELKEMSADDTISRLEQEGKWELHKPYIDEVTLNCPKCNGCMKRISEVIDCWYDSGAMPFAQFHYPFEQKDLFESRFPADWISEAVDQTRGWFYSLIAISTAVFGKQCYNNVISLGHVLDKDGVKMSKHKGNVVDPWAVLNKQGADAVRWYFMVNSSPWLPNRFYEEAVNEAQRKFMGTLWNTYAFFVLYANIDGFSQLDYAEQYNMKNLPPMDRWILSKLNSLIDSVDKMLSAYRLTEPARAMNDFVDELSNWYVRRCRERFWGSGMPQDKINAYMTLHTVLVTLTKLAAPFVPFITEEIYSNLVRSVDVSAPESVHLCDFPQPDASFIDEELEQNMELTRQITVLGRAARNYANIKNRQPLGNMYIQSARVLPAEYHNIILDELNVKELSFIDDTERFTVYKFKPQLKTLGPRYGKLLPKISQVLAVSGNDFMRELQSGGATIDVDGTDVSITIDDVLVETEYQTGYAAESDHGVSVALKTELTPELIEEGFVRELISKLQTMRKEAGFEVLDRIDIFHTGNKKISDVFANNESEIKAQVLADHILSECDTLSGGYSKEWDINGENITLAVQRI